MTPTAQFVRYLAQVEDIRFNELYVDHWASAVTKLTGDEVKSDATDDLLVALTSSGKLTPVNMVALLIEHHRELKRT